MIASYHNVAIAAREANSVSRQSNTGLCQNFYEAACQVTRSVREIDILQTHSQLARAVVQAA
jgi:hypothetical protein